MTEHTHGQIVVEPGMAAVGLTIDSKHIAHMAKMGTAQEAVALATHLAACWNACEGINPEAVPELLEAYKAAVPILARACVCSRLETPLGEAQCPPCLAAGILRAAIAKATKGE